MTTERKSYGSSNRIDVDVVEVKERERSTSGERWQLHGAQAQVAGQATFSSTYNLSVIVPTGSERNNIRSLLEALYEALSDLYVEVIFVDDGDDDTPEIIKNVINVMNSPLFHICLEHRVAGAARAGSLATAVVYGLDRAQAEYIAVLDADLQYLPAQLRALYDQAIAQNVDVVVASRYTEAGSYQGLDSIGRRLISIGGKWTAKLLFPERLFCISDPLGGFFLLRRSLLVNVSLHPIRYKILLGILLRCQRKHVIEIPGCFQALAHGQRKANMQQGCLFLQHMRHLWHEVPAAGRIWKLGLLFLFNGLIALTLLRIHPSFSSRWINLSNVLFGMMACLDFFLLTRFLFPASPVIHPAEPTESPTLFMQDAVTLSTPAVELDGTSTIELQQTARLVEKKERSLTIIVAITTILAISWISYTHPGALMTLAVVLAGAAIVFTKRVKFDQAITMVLAIAVGFSSIDYISWRFAVTNWYGWWIAVPLLLAEIFGTLHTLGFQITIWPWSPPSIESEEDPTRHPIFIFIPTVNEGVAILRPTLEGAIVARDAYLARVPHGKVTIVVCNDGLVAKIPNWEEVDRLAGELGVCCVTRTRGGGAKAGNIENARQQLRATDDALLVIFDADQIAKSDFLLKTIPPFRDPKIGWVQTGQYYANLDNPVSRWADDQQSLFYNLLCPGKAALNATFICGTNVVIRAVALDEIGGLPQDSVTEDFAASIILHPSWRSFYITDILATGLGPLDVSSYLEQQRRWAIGTLGVFRSHWRAIFLPDKHGLRIGQRIQYFLACTHYLCGLRDLIYVLSPIFFAFSGIPAVRGSTVNGFLWHFIPYCLFSYMAFWYSARGITGLRGVIIGFGCFPVLVESLLSVILQRKVAFSVTSKQRRTKRSSGYFWLYASFFFLCIVSLYRVTQVKGQQQVSLFVSVFWIIYSMLMLGSFLGLSLKDLRFQEAVQQFIAGNKATAKQLYPEKLLTRKRGLEPVWNLGLSVLVACPILASNTLTPVFVKSQSLPFMIDRERISTPYFGVSLPVQLLTHQPLILEHDLGTQISIIGRTQDIVHDRFDVAWASQLVVQHAQPWITLQFGVFGPGRKPPLDASLPAIINGLHDQEIRNWARDIRNYGKPVYLTILLHADRNWSLSSGVAHGGIPQDISSAWLHVQSIFRIMGADNVAWVWAPDDPIHDQKYAPPPSAIDAVLQSFFDYPDTQWNNPATVLQLLAKHYPTKPILVEASVNGPAEQKAVWLTKLGHAVNDIPQVYALLYHEGGPGLNMTRAQIEDWSLASDPMSLAAMRNIIGSWHQRSLA